MIFGVGTGRREGFGATTDREAISAQDNGFRGVAIGVAGGVIESELWEVDFAVLIGGVRTNAGSLGVGVAGGVRTAGIVSGVGPAVVVILTGSAFGVSVGAAGDCSGVGGGVGIAAAAGTAFDAGWAVSRRGGVGGASTLGVGFPGFFDARYFSVARIQWHVGECSQCFR